MISRRGFMSLVGGGAAFVATGCGGGTISPGPPAPAPPTPQPPGQGVKDRIEHIVFTMQENRSFDHYFGRLPQYRAGRGIAGQVDGLPENASNPARDDPSQLVHNYHIITPCHENLSPSWNESHRQWNRNDPTSPTPKLDGFVYTQANFSRSTGGFDTEGRRAMGWYDERDIPFYYELASQFAISDRMFASVMAATLPNRMYLLAASSFGRVSPDYPAPQQVQADTIFDLCEKNGVSWKIYVNGGFTYYSWFSGSRQHSSKIVPADQFFDDAAGGKLPQVAMFEAGTNTGLDEHPKNDIQKGANYMRRFVNALMKSPAWPKTAAFLTYDEGGGFFDHVPPQPITPPDDIAPIFNPEKQPPDTPGSFGRTGYRVPFIAISPWAKRHYVAHTVADHTSILRFIERRFDLPSLSRRDAAAHDLLDMFDFSSMQLETPPALPDQAFGPCGMEDWKKV